MKRRMKKMDLYSSGTPVKHRGAVLVIALLLLLILSMVSVTAMDRSVINFKMSANSIYHEEAFNHSESARNSSLAVIDDYLYAGNWNDVLMPSGLSINVGGGKLELDNAASEDLMNNESLQQDFSLRDSAIQGDVFVLKGSTVYNHHGAGSAQYKGYGGTGVGAGAAGGVFKYYEFRSVGTGRSNTKSWTASDYRYVR